MKKTYAIGRGIYSENAKAQKLYVRKTRYSVSSEEQSRAEYIDTRINRLLPTALDVFSDLPDYVYKNNHAKSFLECLRRKIMDYDPLEIEGIVLSKLQVSEATERLLLIEWIYNYFRIYYAFDRDDGDYRGVVMNDPDKDRFTNDVKKMKPEEYDDFAEADLAYIVMMAEGNVDGLSG